LTVDQYHFLLAKLSGKPYKAEVRIEKNKNIKFCVDSLDLLTGGGLETCEITQIFGGYFSAKSQLALQLALNVQLPQELGGLSGKAVYVKTKGKFLEENFSSMMVALKKQHEGTLVDSINFEKNIIVVKVNIIKKFIRFVRENLSRILASNLSCWIQLTKSSSPKMSITTKIQRN
jgi:RecA/RadA recombinase